MGWLGWTWREAMTAPMPAIVIAQRGRADLLTQIFGGKKEKEEETGELAVEERRRRTAAKLRQWLGGQARKG